MLFRYHRVADTFTLETAGFDEACRVVARRIAENRAAIAGSHGLSFGATPQQFLDAQPRVSVLVCGQPQLRGREPFFTGAFDTAVTDHVLVRRAPAKSPVTRDRLHRFHEIPGLAAEGAGVHGQRASQRTRDASEEFTAAHLPRGTVLRHLGTGDTRLHPHAGTFDDFDPIELVGGDDRAVDTSVAHQYVAAQPQPEKWFVPGQTGHELGEIVYVRGPVETLRRPADAPHGVARQGFVGTQLAAILIHAQCRGRHGARRPSFAGARSAQSSASSGARVPISPAPSTSNTSPSASTPGSIPARSASLSTNTGST